jgi:hypothetical protein
LAIRYTANEARYAGRRPCIGEATQKEVNGRLEYLRSETGLGMVPGVGIELCPLRGLFSEYVLRGMRQDANVGKERQFTHRLPPAQRSWSSKPFHSLRSWCIVYRLELRGLGSLEYDVH